MVKRDTWEQNLCHRLPKQRTVHSGHIITHHSGDGPAPDRVRKRYGGFDIGLYLLKKTEKIALIFWKSPKSDLPLHRIRNQRPDESGAVA